MKNLVIKIEEFKKSLQDLPNGYYEQMLSGVSQDRSISFILNPLITSHVFPKIDKYKSVLPNSYCMSKVVYDEFKFTFENFQQPFIYNISLSSLLSPYLLNLQVGESVLDMCAAPGGKSFYSAVLTNNQINLFSVEQNRSRFFKMSDNLSNLGVINREVINTNGYLLSKRFPNLYEYFDKIILDAPCSNESNLNINNPQTFKFWNRKLTHKLPKLQKRLLSSAVNLLKPGGSLMYSTCTYNKLENEDVIEWALGKFPDIYLEKLDFEPAFPNLKRGIGNLLDKTIRVLPYEGFTGFYLAKIRKILR